MCHDPRRRTFMNLFYYYINSSIELFQQYLTLLIYYSLEVFWINHFVESTTEYHFIFRLIKHHPIFHCLLHIYLYKYLTYQYSFIQNHLHVYLIPLITSPFPGKPIAKCTWFLPIVFNPLFFIRSHAL